MAIQPKVIALGFFDGVHLGHGALLRRTAAEAKRRGVRSAVFTWAQPPKEVVSGVPVPLINSPEDRAWLAKNLYGIDEVIMVPFDHDDDLVGGFYHGDFGEALSCCASGGGTRSPVRP